MAIISKDEESLYIKFKKRAFQCRSRESFLQTTKNEGGLKKVLNATDLTMLGVGAIIGAGIFVLTGEVAKNISGPSVTLSYLISSLAALFSALCYAEFAADLPVAGGSYNYIAFIDGEFIAWQASLTIVMEGTFGIAAVSKGFSSYLASLIGLNSGSFSIEYGYINIDIMALIVVASLCLILAFGIKESSLFNVIVTASNLTVILFVIIAAIPHSNLDHFDNFFPYGTRGTIEGAGIVFFAYLGFDMLSSVAEETRNPEKDLPLGILSSLIISALLYVMITIALISMVSYNEIDVNAPFSEAFVDVGMKWAGRLVSAGALFGIITTILTSLLAQTRLLLTMGRDNILPPWIGKLSKRKTPQNACICTGIVSGIFSLLFDIELLSKMVSMGTFVVLTLVSLAVIQRRYYKNGEKSSFSAVGWRITCIILFSILEGISFTLEWNGFLTSFFLIIWFLVTLSFSRLPVIFESNKFNVPFKPFFPGIAVFANIHLMFSLGWLAHLSFLIIQILGIIGYFVYVLKKPCIEEKSPNNFNNVAEIEIGKVDSLHLIGEGMVDSSDVKL